MKEVVNGILNVINKLTPQEQNEVILIVSKNILNSRKVKADELSSVAKSLYGANEELEKVLNR